MVLMLPVVIYTSTGFCHNVNFSHCYEFLLQWTSSTAPAGTPRIWRLSPPATNIGCPMSQCHATS